MARTSPLSLAGHVLFHQLLSPHREALLASFKLTYRCNLRCRQCPFTSYEGADASFEQVRRTLDELHRRGVRLVIFEGGEPLLWRDGGYTFAEVARYARQRFPFVGATTNGTLPLDVPADLLWVSLDGLAATHNHLRGAEIFDKIITHIRASSHPRLFAHITANAENHAEIPDLVRFLRPLVKGITVQFFYPYGSDDTLFLPWPERRALLERLIALKRQGYPILNSTAALRALKDNRWRCLPWLIASANPDGSITQGCYLSGRAKIDCSLCGFSPYTEMSLAFRGNAGAILAGMRIFA
jgi:MoaA/NifB/PqqE/SkfB family radical SAM enzyme